MPSGCQPKVLKTLAGGRGPSWVGPLGSNMAITAIKMDFKKCNCADPKAITVETSNDGKEFNLFQYAGSFNTSKAPISKSVYRDTKATHIRISGSSFSIINVTIFGSCEPAPLPKEEEEEERFVNPKVHASAEQELEVETEGHDIKTLKGSRMIETDQRVEMADTKPVKDLGDVGTQKESFFAMGQKKHSILSVIDDNLLTTYCAGWFRVFSEAT